MRAVTSGTAAFAIGIAKKDLDNIVSRHQVRGLQRGRQGVARRLSLESIEQIAIAVDLARDYAIPIPEALSLADQALASPDGVVATRSGTLALKVNLDQLRRSLQARLTDAIEHVIPPRRGRPFARN